jgi:hypothetical protein
MSTHTCRACHQSVGEGDNFCSHCGVTAPGRRRRRWPVAIAVVLGLCLFAAIIGGLVWYTSADRGYSTHGVSFRESGWSVDDLSSAELRTTNSDWAVELSPYQNGGEGGVIRIYGTRTSSHEQASKATGDYVAAMTAFAKGEQATHIDGPRLTSLPADGAAMAITWQSSNGGGRYYAIAVGNQTVLVVCLGPSDGSSDEMNAACTRITETIKSTS